MENKFLDQIEKTRRDIADSTEVVKLDSGLNVILEYAPDAPSIFKGDLFVEFGSIDESPNDDGTAHFLEHMSFGGTKKFPSRKTLDKKMRELGYQLNASTSKNRMLFPFSSLDDDFELTLDLVTQIAFDQQFNDESLERERLIILNEYATAFSNPFSHVNEWVLSNFVSGFPFRHHVLGTPETIQAMSLETLARYRNSFMVPNNAHLTLVGRIDDKKLKVVNDLITKFKAVEIKHPEIPVEREITQRERYEQGFEGLSRTHVVYNFRLPTLGKTNDFGALYLTKTVLSGITSSRLSASLRERNGLTYDISVNTESNKHYGCFSIITNVDNSQAEIAIRLIDEELTKLAEYGPTDEELNEAKKRVYIGLFGAFYSPGSKADERFAKETTGFNNLDTYEGFFSAIGEDVKRVTKKYLMPEKSNVSIARPL